MSPILSLTETFEVFVKCRLLWTSMPISPTASTDGRQKASQLLYVAGSVHFLYSFNFLIHRQVFYFIFTFLFFLLSFFMQPVPWLLTLMRMSLRLLVLASF